ncbi:HAMP domain-containing sensor histidine kinase [Phycicoccus sp. SLBN-51]|jgi:signal transduction histidine kinase|uniref:sensor histidine kinase n=1 Tax=Phycicoccus sp. SLBN-51 TaxID=2768447 RepID=UPI0011540ECA|nr:HAMP domain-containing sensor histidine kinase [Phycicoccus sp. SLBN-51]
MTALVEDLSRAASSRDIDTIRALCHDLRQPLAAILLLSGSGDGDVGRKMEVITDQARWLSQLVDTVLTDASTDAVQAVDVAELAAMAAERARPTAGCDVTVRAEGHAYAWARPVALGRAVACVLDNAIRAAGAGGHVQVTVEQEPECVHLTIADDGPGLGKVASRTSLGLTTTRAMVAACDGTFDLRSGADAGAEAEICLQSVSRRTGLSTRSGSVAS